MMMSQNLVVLIGCILFCQCPIRQCLGISTHTNATYTSSPGHRGNADTSTLLGCRSSIEAVVVCQINGNCHGVNFNPTGGICELLLEPSTVVQVDPAWIFYQLTVDNQCDWYLWNDRCFTFVSGNFDHDQAMMACNGLGAGTKLISLNTVYKNTFVMQKAADLGIQNMYIGFTRVLTTSVFEWDNADPVTFTNWGSGEPNNQDGLESYVVASEPQWSYTWWDVVGSTWHANVICEKIMS